MPLWRAREVSFGGGMGAGGRETDRGAGDEGDLEGFLGGAHGCGWVRVANT